MSRLGKETSSLMLKMSKISLWKNLELFDSIMIGKCNLILLSLYNLNSI